MFEPYTDLPALRLELGVYLAEIGASDLNAVEMAARFLSDPGFTALRICNDGPAGFVILDAYEGGTDIAEFYIQPAHRRQGLGIRAAHAAFARAPGSWGLGAMPQAIAFWRHAISTCPGMRDLRTSPSDNPTQALFFHFTIGTAP